jgi:ABC-type glycerol-3-phosphate transport system substrate-binding protein
MSVIFVLLSDCSSDNTEKKSETNSTVTVNKIPIKWMSTWTFRKGKRKLVESSAREFEILNQDINIHLWFNQEIWPKATNTEQPLQHTLEMIRSGKYDWDICNIDKYIYTNVTAELKDPKWTKKYLVDFSEFDWFRNSHESTVIEDPAFREGWGGIIPGPIIEGYYHAFWYNKKLADKIGLKIKPMGMTFNDLKEYLQKAYEYNKTAKDKIILLSETSPSKIKTDLLDCLIMSALGEVDTSRLDLTRNLKALKRALDSMEELSKFKPLEIPVTIDPKVDPVLDGKALFGIFPSTIYNIWEAVDKEKLKDVVPIELPIFENPPMFYMGSYQSVWAVFKDSPHKDEAIRVIKFMCTNDIAERWISLTKNPTALKVRINASKFNQDEIDRFNTNIESKYKGKLSIYKVSKILFGYRRSSIVLDGLPILRGKISADEYYNSIVKQVR